MVHQFDSSLDAVNAVCGTLEAHCPEDVVEVVATYHHSSMAAPRKVDVRSLRSVLNDLCGVFPRAFVQYNEQDVNGEIAMIWCQCEEEERRKCAQYGQCEGPPNSPRVTIILDQHNGEAVWVGLRKPPARPG